METIKQLPENVRNMVRSGIVLFDLSRVVEELILNSLDAGAGKVSVFVGVRTCYVKVMDDGCGISRDGLMLLGERYATSKLHQLADMDAACKTFGFRGEALASISDVSLIEIATKAYGRPTGYRKVMKGSKCLYLGIDDDRKNVGTTVVVRDLFYNQPVRRKCMQASPKKFLHSIKKCILRIALVHPAVSFRFVDVESEAELLKTNSSSSSLSLLMSGFGIEDCNFLHELNANDGVLTLSGYISSPCENFTFKAFQYVYINSRFTSKGPIHKLLNQLASSFECSNSWNKNIGTQKGKRSRLQTFPAYILNLSCPRALYDLTFEPSKTYAAFKDWEPILTFIKEAIQTVWAENITYGEPFGLLGKDGGWKEDADTVSAQRDLFDSRLLENAESQLEFQNGYASFPPSLAMGKHTTEDNPFSDEGFQRITFPEFQVDNVEFAEKTSEMGIVCQAGYSFHSSDGSFSESLPILPRKIHPWTSEDNCFLRNKPSAAENLDNLDVDFLSSHSGKEHRQSEPGLMKRQFGVRSSFVPDDFSTELELSKDIKEPYLRSCLQRSLQHAGTGFAAEEGLISPVDSFKKKKKRVSWDERVEILDDISKENFGLSPRALFTGKVPCVQGLSRNETSKNMFSGFDLLLRASPKTFSSCAEPLKEENRFVTDPTTLLGNSGSGHRSLNYEWCSVSDPFVEANSWNDGDPNNDAMEGSSGWGEEIDCRLLEDSEENCKLSVDVGLQRRNTSSINNQLDFDDQNYIGNGIYKFCPEFKRPKNLSPEHPNGLIDGTDWLCPVPYGNASMSKHELQSDQFRHQNCEQISFPNERSKRSQSAPPFHRFKRKFVSLHHSTRMQAAEQNDCRFQNLCTSQDVGESNHTNSNPSSLEDLNVCTRPDKTKNSDTMLGMKSAKKGEICKLSPLQKSGCTAQVEDFVSKEIRDSEDCWTKWRDGSLQITKSNRSHFIHNQDNILDIYSGLLHLAGDSLVPESIDKNCLEDAKVLQQVDKKFIPIVAGGTLAVIDQHAADERIRLEELRQKVLSGEARTMEYLGSELELALPEMGYQLLHNFSEQIKDWGWICSIHTQSSSSFKTNLNFLHRHTTVVTLLAVPCILGVNLSDVDLLEYLQQLADTDGSSTTPPAVLNVLNSKACRGAIMFGDSLLPSECSLIVEELKQTSLCFQCAHGRPTMVPLVNLEALHEQITQLGGVSCNSIESWHGLRRHEISVERASQRLSAARE